jgi:2-oxoglutarate dehydrogenase E1 component
MPVLEDKDVSNAAKKVIFCSGKIYYPLINRRREINATDTAIVRVELLYPFPEKELKRIVGRYKKAAAWIWAQEEPANMGAWPFIQTRLAPMLKKPLRYVGRQESASPATGFPKIYRMEQDDIVDRAVGPKNQGGQIS